MAESEAVLVGIGIIVVTKSSVPADDCQASTFPLYHSAAARCSKDDASRCSKDTSKQIRERWSVLSSSEHAEALSLDFDKQACCKIYAIFAM